MTTTPDHQAGSAPEPGAPSALNLPGARFDPVTGAELTGRDGDRRRGSYALQQGEPVMSFNLVSSLLPMASGTAPQTYRWALGLGLLVPVVAGALGYLAFAFVAAALVVPVVYLVYMYDVNQWDDQPLGVVLGAVGVAGVLGVGFTWLWHSLLDSGAALTGVGAGMDSISWKSLLVLCLLVPVVSEILKQVGPVVLARRPAFDDLIDALTFGIAAGSAYAAAETIVVNRALFGSLGHIDKVDSGFWVSLILSAAIVKPVVYGAATGIAVAAFSGVGRGYRGFKAPYLRGLAEAIGANIAFQLALFLAGRVGGTRGAVLGLVLGAIVAVVMVVRLRYLLHVSVLEAALETAAGGELKDTAHGTAWCPSCHLPLLEGANFCVACGTAVRAASKVTRRRNAAATDAAGPAAVEPPDDNKRTALVVGSAIAVVVAAGLLGQVAAAASSDVETADSSDIQITPSLDGAGIDPAPSPAPAPGPSVSPSVAPSVAPSAYVAGAGTSSAQDVSADDLFLPGVGSEATDGGIRLSLADGWEVIGSSSTRIVAGKGHAVLAVDVTQPPADIGAMMQANLKDLIDRGMQELGFTPPTQLPLPSADFVAAARMDLRGMMASQQGGAVPLEGFAIYLVRQDGVGITATGLFSPGELDRTPALVKEYSAMLGSLIGQG
jgi:hypothetical protein